jgi:hypothetical protein
MFSNESWEARLRQSRCPCCVATQQISIPSHCYPDYAAHILSQWERNQRHTISKTENRLKYSFIMGREHMQVERKEEGDRGTRNWCILSFSGR